LGDPSPLEEITGKRPTNYSKWHRPPTLPSWCYMTDGDWFEQRVRNGKLISVAYIETIEIDNPSEGDKTHPVWKSKKSLLLEIQEKMDIPSYIVWHNAECTDFLVLRISETKPKRMNQNEYKAFIKSL